MYSVHAHALNLARRDSIRNENDLLQESFCDALVETKSDDSFSQVSEPYCFSLLQYGMPLPEECQRFRRVSADIQRHQSGPEGKNASEATKIAFQGMSPHETLEAIRAREHGLPHHAQIQRRMTNPQNSQSTWF